jgi:hypothetical protein
MPFLTSKIAALVFTTGLVIFTSLVRSEVIIDTSLLPRALSLTIVLLLTYVLMFWRTQIFRAEPWIYALIGFYLWSLASCLWSTSVTEAIMQSQLIFLGIGVFGIISIFDRQNENFISIYIRTHIIVLLFSFILAFHKMNTLDFYDPYKIISISINNNLYSGFLLLSLSVLLSGYSLFRGAWKYVTVLTFILSIFFIIILQSRAVFMGLTLSVIVISTILVLRYRLVFSLKNILTGLLSLSILVLALSLFYHSLDGTRRNAFKSKVAVWSYFSMHKDDKNSGEVKEEKKSVEEDVQSTNQVASPALEIPVEYFENVNTRLIFWKKSIGLIRMHPLAGVGAGNWRIQIESIPEPPNPELTLRNFTYSQPHNEWICILSELGVVGFLLALLVFIAPIILILFRLLLRKDKIPVSAVFFTGIIAGFYVFAFFDFPFKRIEHIVLFFSVLAFLFNMAPIGPEKEIQNRFYPIRKAFPFAFVSVLIFSGIVFIARLKGEANTLNVFRNERRNDNAVIQYCHLAKNAFYAITPNTLPIDWFEGVAHYRLGETNAALKCFESALKSTPYEVRLKNDYGTALYSLGKTDQAINVLKNTLKIDPNFDEPKFNLSAIYYSASNRDSALFFASQCRDSQKKKDYLDEINASRKK